MLEIKSFNDVSNVTEPVGVVLIQVGLTPVSVARKVFGNLIHVLKGLRFVLLPNLCLLVNQISEDAFELLLILREMK